MQVFLRSTFSSWHLHVKVLLSLWNVPQLSRRYTNQCVLMDFGSSRVLRFYAVLSLINVYLVTFHLLSVFACTSGGQKETSNNATCKFFSFFCFQEFSGMVHRRYDTIKISNSIWRTDKNDVNFDSNAHLCDLNLIYIFL